MKNEIVRTMGVILQLLFFTAATSAQTEPHRVAADTIRVHQVLLVDPGIALGKPILLLPPSLMAGSTEEPLFFPGVRPGLPPPLIDRANALHVDLLSPYLLQQQRARQFSTLTSVLGTVQLGGVAYLAYKHIKKYGLFR